MPLWRAKQTRRKKPHKNEKRRVESPGRAGDTGDVLLPVKLGDRVAETLGRIQENPRKELYNQPAAGSEGGPGPDRRDALVRAFPTCPHLEPVAFSTFGLCSSIHFAGRDVRRSGHKAESFS